MPNAAGFASLKYGKRLSHLNAALGIMREEATLMYSEALVRRAIFQFWRRTVGWGFPIALLICAVGVVSMLMRGDKSWLVGLVGAVFVLGVAIFVQLYLSHYRNSMAKFRALQNARASLSLDSATFTLTSSEGSSTIPWKTVSEIWKFEEFWLLLFSKAQFVTLPLESLTDEMRSIISDRVREAGGKVDA
jgi:hypothetical protein